MTEIRENRLSFSSDVLGFVASPRAVNEMYQRAGWQDFGLEVIGMPLQMGVLYRMMHGHEQGFRLDGVHGRLGVENNPLSHRGGVVNWLKIKTADMLMRKAHEGEFLLRDMMFPHMGVGVMLRLEIIAGTKNLPIYYNVHNLSVENSFPFYRDKVVPVTKYSHLTIENGGAEGDIENTVDLVTRLRGDTGRYVSGTLDFAHVLIELSGGGDPDMDAVNKYWATALSLFNPEIFHHVHIPIGLNTKDSIPVEEMLTSGSELSDLIAIFKENGTHITFENQHSLLIGAKNVAAEMDRLVRIRDGLGEAGL